MGFNDFLTTATTAIKALNKPHKKTYNEAKYIDWLTTENFNEKIRENGNVAVASWYQFGDEGKGKIASGMESVDWIAVATGWWNAGHSVEVINKKTGKHEEISFHELPGWAVVERAKIYIGKGRSIRIPNLIKEVGELDKIGHNTQEKVIIAGHAHVNLKSLHWFLDRFIEKLKGKNGVGSTLQGIGPLYATKALRTGITINTLIGNPNKSEEENQTEIKRLVDLNVNLFLNPDSKIIEEVRNEYKEKWATHKEIKEEIQATQEQMKSIWGNKFVEEIFSEALEARKQLTEQIDKGVISIDKTSTLMRDEAHAGKKIFVECSQSNLLSSESTGYPFVTSSDTSVNGVRAALLLPAIGTSIGVVKIAKSRVGNWPFPTQIQGEAIEKFGLDTGEKWSTTGRPRDLWHIDLVELIHVIKSQQTDMLLFNKADLLARFCKEVEPLKICIAYKDTITGKEYTDTLPAHRENIEPVYSNKTYNIQEGIEGIKNEKELPDTYREFFNDIVAWLNFKGNILLGTWAKDTDKIVYTPPRKIQTRRDAIQWAKSQLRNVLPLH